MRDAPKHARRTAVAAEPPALRVDRETRRVYVKGVEARPALSSEQFRLLSYLYQRAGKVVARDELVQQSGPMRTPRASPKRRSMRWCGACASASSQAGGERSYIVTLRGQGFRLDASTRAEDRRRREQTQKSGRTGRSVVLVAAVGIEPTTYRL